ncbi:hypothetical protein LTR37_003771 [Vermiconidia calcicola]|uniref:Uncharacterized protein n=1 Tax=Vermiconidia calcicola TaxID=1690605 RepID=A0ACC3NPC5_9PEZI|nr:hypothetical protein LTR37_003771 [Vermiconidia calcicola]
MAELSLRREERNMDPAIDLRGSRCTSACSASRMSTTSGLIFLSSKIKDPPKIADEQYNRFYSEAHAPDLLRPFSKKGGITNAVTLQYENTNSRSAMPYLALHPVPDAQWISSPDQGHFQEDTKKRRILAVDDVRQYIEVGFRPYEKIQTFEGYGHAFKSGTERGRTLVCVAMEPAESEEQDLEDWYRKQHLDILSMCRGYRRTTRYKRLDGQKPRYLALHEYACLPDALPANQSRLSGRERSWLRAQCSGGMFSS